MRRVADVERRVRLGRRHALAPGSRVADVEAATRAMVVLHATEAASVHLAAAARVDRISVADVDRTLYETRSVVKQLAMRRTLFVFPRDLLPASVGSAGVRVAATEQRTLVKHMVAGGLGLTVDAAEQRLAEAERAVLERLATGAELAAREVSRRCPRRPAASCPQPARPGRAATPSRPAS